MKSRIHIMHSAECEACGGDGPLAYSHESAIEAARNAGWAEERDVTRCPECREQANRRGITREAGQA